MSDDKPRVCGEAGPFTPYTGKTCEREAGHGGMHVINASDQEIADAVAKLRCDPQSQSRPSFDWLWITKSNECPACGGRVVSAQRCVRCGMPTWSGEWINPPTVTAPGARGRCTVCHKVCPQAGDLPCCERCQNDAHYPACNALVTPHHAASEPCLQPKGHTGPHQSHNYTWSGS